MKEYLWEINKSQKTAIWKAEVLVVKPAYLLIESGKQIYPFKE